MKKSILSLGKALSKADQRQISGGFDPEEVPHIEIDPSNPTGGWIDGSPEECALPFVPENGRCIHICSSSHPHSSPFVQQWCH